MLRSFSGLTQRELAHRSDISKAMISACEGGRHEFGPVTLRRLLAALELPFRAWCEAVAFAERLEYLASRHGQTVRRTVDLQSLQREADALAESFGRDRERQAAGLLDLALDVLVHLGTVGET
jgi:transcriptional regulator with XRE-family HTH domain